MAEFDPAMYAQGSAGCDAGEFAVRTYALNSGSFQSYLLADFIAFNIVVP